LTLLISARSMSSARCASRSARTSPGTAGHAIVEARADGNQEIAVVDRIVRERGAVHAQHAQGERVRGVEGADAHQRGDDRDAESPCANSRSCADAVAN
jgi:hypothetical protein